jgi:tyrosine-protein kinase Etk/Wzc
MQETKTQNLPEKITNSDIEKVISPNGTESLNWFKYFKILIKWRWFFVFTTVCSAVVSLIYSLFLPLWYQSSCTIFISNGSSDMLGLTKLLSGNGLDGILGKGKGDDIDRYESIFKSERLRLALIDKFNLMHEYELDQGTPREPIRIALLSLSEQIAFKDNKDGSITVSALFKNDSVKAAQLADFIVVMLDSINRQITTENARNQRVFIQDRYEKSKIELKECEEQLNVFQKEHKVAEIKDQVKASLDASAQMEAAALQSEVEYNALVRTLGKDNPQVIQAKSKTDELRRQAKKFESGGLSSDIIIPFSKMPDLSMDYLRLYRNVLLQAKILEFLIPQFEQAKIQEAKDTPTLLVLDKARVPEWKTKPKRLNIIFFTTLLTLGCSVVSVALFEWLKIEKRKNTDFYLSIKETQNIITHDFRSVGRLFGK